MEVTRTVTWSWTDRKRRRDTLDVFFEEGDRCCFMSERQVVVEVDELHEVNRLPEFPCGISGCSDVFDTISGYESHYNSVHRHTCTECRRAFPSSHLLDTHLRESHDPLFQLRTGDKFLCLVEGCASRFGSAKSRRNHLVKVHKYPASFRFHRSKQPSTPTPPNPQQQKQRADLCSMDVSESTCSQQRAPLRVYSYKVPQSICFGHGSSRGFKRGAGRRRGKHWHQSKMDADTDTTVHIENVNMTDLSHALIES